MAARELDSPDEPKFIRSFIIGKDDENLQEQNDEVLALQSFYEGGDIERIQVLSAPGEDGTDLFSIKITVPIQEQVGPITMNILVPAGLEEIEHAGEARPVIPPLPQSVVNFRRSDSGQKWIGSLKIHHLSPLALQITFPPSYPSHSPPVFTMSSSWLSSTQMSAICKQLDELWTENINMAITFTWINWLENNILAFLGITDSILMMNFENDESRDPRALPESVDLGCNIISISQYNRQQEEIKFCENEQDCDVCFDRRPGTEFFRVGKCGHHYCVACMAEYCELHVKEGTVEELKCPDRECELTLPPHIIQTVLPPGAFDRWERLMLQKTLGSMADVVWCPRCNRPVIKEIEESLNLAHCTNCFYSFCTECNESWHQGKVCETEADKLQDLEKKGPPIGNAAKQKFDEMVKIIQEEIDNRKLLAQKVKQCPKCKVSIEKIGGCSQMVCRCKQLFCWACGKVSCRCYLYSDSSNVVPIQMPAEDPHWVQANLESNPEMRNRMIHCPCCKQQNLKSNNNNHLKCWNCTTSFCFQCKKRITGGVTPHFAAPSLCKQHSWQ